MIAGQAYGVEIVPRAGDPVMILNTGAITAARGIDSAFGGSSDIFGGQALAVYNGTGPVSIANSGTILSSGYAGVLLDDNIGTVSLSNSGLIEADGVCGRGVSLIESPENSNAPVALVAVVNSGIIRATGNGLSVSDGLGTSVELANAIVFGPGSLTNTASGLIEATGTGVVAAVHFEANAVTGPCTGCQDGYQSASLTNAGTVRGPDGFLTFANAGTRFDIVAGAVFGRFGDYTVTNTGLIQGSIYLGNGNDDIENSGTINGQILLGTGNNRFFELLNAANSGTVTAGTGYNTLVLDGSSGGAYAATRYVGFQKLRTQGGGTFDVGGGKLPDLEVAGGTVTVSANAQAGELLLGGGTFHLAPGVTLAVPAGVTGTANGSTLIVEGTLQGAVSLGAGNDTARFVNGGSASGAVDGGGGVNTLELGIAADTTYEPTHYRNFQHLIASGAGVLGFGTNANFTDIAVNGAGLSIGAGAVVSAGQVTGGAQPISLRIDGTLNVPVALGNGGNMVVLNGTLGGDLTLGGGVNSLALGQNAMLGGKVTGSGADTLAIALGQDRMIDGGQVTGFATLAAAGLATLTLTGAAQAYRSLAVSRGNLSVQTLLTAPVALTGGNQTLTIGGDLIGTATASGSGNTLVLDQAAGATRNLQPSRFGGFQTLQTIGAGLLVVDASASFTQVGFAGDLTIATGATLSAPVLTGTDAAHRVQVDGTLIGALQFGEGNDTLVLSGTLTGSADGGGGRNTLELRRPNAPSPSILAGSNFAHFQALDVSSGSAIFSGNLAGFDTVRIASGATLGGIRGSTLQAGQISIDAGGTLLAPSLVTGDVAVVGTLAPGVANGNTRLIGNAVFAGGSTLFIGSVNGTVDSLTSTGSVSIGNGATLALAGVPRLAPATSVDVLVAGGGLSGTFTTVTDTVPSDYIRTLANRIQVVGLFAPAPAAVGQSAAAIVYVNGLLVANQGSPALVAALPALADASGASRAAAFNLLTPEPYATAGDLAIDHGLMLVDATRTRQATSVGGGWTSFAQGLGNRRTLDGNTTSGTSRASTNAQGVIGGLGYGFAGVSVDAFVGYVDSEQHIGNLDARTQASGIVGGVYVNAKLLGLNASALVAYDGSDAKTTRGTPGGTASSGRYKAGGWIADARLAYSLPLAPGFALEPNIGASYIEAQRGGTTESGSPYALAVDAHGYEHIFGDAGLALKGSLGREALHFTPYLSIGVRHALKSAELQATGSFVGSDIAGLNVRGAGRDRTSARLGAGAGVDLARGVASLLAIRASSANRPHATM